MASELEERGEDVCTRFCFCLKFEINRKALIAEVTPPPPLLFFALLCKSLISSASNCDEGMV
jgi:hypothetical protein